MRLRSESFEPRSRSLEPESRSCTPEMMRDELSHALFEALFELEVLPESEEGALLGLYAVMDDLQEAIHRAECLDRPNRA